MKIHRRYQKYSHMTGNFSNKWEEISATFKNHYYSFYFGNAYSLIQYHSERQSLWLWAK